MKTYRRRLFFTAIFSLLFIPQTPAQEHQRTIISAPVFIGQEQVFTLKNGTVITGTPTCITPDGRIVEIRLGDGSVKAIGRNDIAKAKHARRGLAQSRFMAGGGETEFEIYGQYGSGMGSYRQDRAEGGFVVRGGVSDYLFVGGGAGVGYMMNYETYGIPLFANVRAYMCETNVGVLPFVDVTGGYYIGTLRYYDEQGYKQTGSGAVVQFGLGINGLWNEPLHYGIMLGYRLQSLPMSRRGGVPYRQWAGTLVIQAQAMFRW